MDIVISIAVGFAWGALISLVKYLVCWKPLLATVGGKPVSAKSIGIRYGINLLFDVFALIVPLFLKEYLPFSLNFVLIGTAVALALLNRVYSLNKVLRAPAPEDQSSESEGTKTL